MIDGIMVIRLRRRKHRPEGATLQRKCTCGHTMQLNCVVCQFASWIRERSPVPGQLLFPGNAHRYLSELRRMLSLLYSTGAMTFTLKAYRAGKATQLTKDGATWQQLQEAGQWRGTSALAYVNRQAVDQYAAIQAAIEASSDEET